MLFSFATIFFSTAFLYTPTAGQTRADELSYTDTVAFRSVTLEYHNRRRAERDTAGLTWDTKMADDAEKYAQMCNWGHSDVAGYGENLAGGYSSLPLALNAWSDEQMNYKSLADYDRADPPQNTGHFTQMVWVGTSKIGCGRAKCRGLIRGSPTFDAWYVVCRYSERGNVRGRYPENVRKPVRREDP